MSDICSNHAFKIVIALALGISPSTTRYCGAQQVTGKVAKSKSRSAFKTGTEKQRKWLSSSVQQRIQLAEELGENGARKKAAELGWHSLMDGTVKSIKQGPDQIYRSSNGTIHVVEAKGGSSPLGNAYGYKQGTPEWSVKSAERMLKSSKITSAEQKAATMVIHAAKNGKLKVYVIRTSHILGEPTAIKIEKISSCTNEATRLASKIGKNLGRVAHQAAGRANSELKLAHLASQSTRKNSSKLIRSIPLPKKQPIPKGPVVVAAVVDTGIRVYQGVEIEQRYASGKISQHDREKVHAKNAAGLVGGWSGALAGAKLGALGGGTAGTAIAPGPGTAIGATTGSIVGGTVGYVGGEVAAETAAEWTVEKVHTTGSTIRNISQNAWKSTVKAFDDTGNVVIQTWVFFVGL